MLINSTLRYILIIVNASIPAANTMSSSFHSISSSIRRPSESVRIMVETFNTASNRKKVQRKPKKESAKNYKGKVIDNVHELYTLTLGMMLGLRCSVRRIMTLILSCTCIHTGSIHTYIHTSY